jgi:DNA-binding CsgD family transcriptional regulator
LIDILLLDRPDVGEGLRQEQPVLTAQELEIMESLAQGLPDKEIVGRVSLNLPNLKKRLRKLYRKLKVFNRMQAVHWWRSRYPFARHVFQQPVRPVPPDDGLAAQRLVIDDE